MTPRAKQLFILTILSSLAAVVHAGGYKIPENSVKSTALAAAYVANAHGADAAYHNPAAMVFNEDRSLLEGNLNYIYLSGIDYSGDVTCACLGGTVNTSNSSEDQHFFIPSFHYSSPAVGNARFGLSVITPVGLTKRWSDDVGRSFAQKFSLKTVEINPSAAYKFSEQFSAALGLRALYSEGIVRSTAAGGAIARDMEGDSWDYGYNLALLFKPTEDLSLALTYRSKIDITAEGNATLAFPAALPDIPYDGFAALTVPAPASTSLALAYDIDDKTTVEFVYERTEWSSYSELDFKYSAPLSFPGVPNTPWDVFDRPREKNWSDTNTYRFGITHQYDSQWTAMAAYAYDETPAPEATLGFELPDSDAHIFSIGGRYAMSEDMTVGAALLYDYKESRTVSSTINGMLDGEFKNASALFVTLGVEVKL